MSYATERMSGIGKPRVEVPPAGFMKDKGPGDIMWEVIETRMTPPVEGKIDKAWLELDRAYKAIAPMTDKPVKIGSISAQILALMLTDQHYNDRLQLLFDMSAALNREYHALADAGAPIVQIEEPAIHQVIARPERADQTRQVGRGLQRRGEGPARQVRGVVPHLLGQPGGAARGEPRPVLQERRCPISISSTSTSSPSRARSTAAWTSRRSARASPRTRRSRSASSATARLQVERPEEIAELIRLALKYIEPERLMLSSDCGFGRQSMSRMHAFYKMVALSRGANIVRKELGLPETDIPATDPKLSMVPLAADARPIPRVPRRLSQSVDRHFLRRVTIPPNEGGDQPPSEGGLG